MRGRSSYDIVEDNCLENKVLIMNYDTGKTYLKSIQAASSMAGTTVILNSSVLRRSRPGPQRCVKLTLGKTDKTFTFTSYVHTHEH